MEPSLKSRPDAGIKRFIEKSPMVSCFCCYGAIKNLQFFEADQQCQTAVWAQCLTARLLCASSGRA